MVWLKIVQPISVPLIAMVLESGKVHIPSPCVRAETVLSGSLFVTISRTISLSYVLSTDIGIVTVGFCKVVSKELVLVG